MAVSAAWLAKATLAQSEPVYIVKIFNNRLDDGDTVSPVPTLVEGENLFTFASRYGFGYPASISSVADVSISIDPIERKPKLSNRSISFRAGDGVIRRLITSQQIRGWRVAVLLGFVDLDEDEFLEALPLIINEILPDENTITLQCQPELSVQTDYQPLAYVTPAVTNFHPFEILDLFLFNAASAGRIPANSWDADSLDPTIAAVGALNGHFNVSYASPMTVDWPVTAYQAASLTAAGYEDHLEESDWLTENVQTLDEVREDLMSITNSYFGPADGGTWVCKPYSRYRAASAIFRQRDTRDFRQTYSYTLPTNKVTIDSHDSISLTIEEPLHAGTTDTGDFAGLEKTAKIGQFVLQSVEAQLRTSPGRTVFNEVTGSSKWVNGKGVISSTSFLGTHTTFLVSHAGQSGFSGCNAEEVEDGVPYNLALAPPSWAEASVDRPVWVMLVGKNDTRSRNGSPTYYPGVREIVKCSSVALIGSTPAYPATNCRLAPDGLYYPRDWEFTLDATAENGGRRQFTTVGTYVRDGEQLPTVVNDDDVWLPNATLALDVTMQVEKALAIIDRFAYGAPVVQVTTGLDKMDVQIGDFVALENDTFLAEGINGATAGYSEADPTVIEGTIFEVVSKSVDALADSPGIRFELIFVRQD